MPTLNITGSGIANAALNTVFAPNISRRKCIKFAVAVGNSHFSNVFGKTQTALSLAAYRAMAVRCVVDFSQAALRPYPEYSQLETSEKANLSYWIGMTFAALAADEVLKVPRTIHALHLGKRIKRANPKSNSLADLVGQDSSNDWHVFEAKGRRGGISAQDRTAWKDQAKTIASVDAVPVTTKNYCVGRIADPFEVELVDPRSYGTNPIDLQIDPNDLGRGYYKSYIDFLQNDPRKIVRNGRTLIVRPIAYDPIEKDFIYVGLEDKYFLLSDPEKPFKFEVGEYEDESLYVGSDGVVIATSGSPCEF